MPEKELLNAYEKLLESFRNKEEQAQLQPLYEAVTAVEKAMEPMFQRDKTYGHLPVVQGTDKTKLMQLHLALGKEAEKLIASDLPEEQKEAVRGLSAQAANNFRHLQAYNLAKASKTLPELLSEARTYVVDTRRAALNNRVGSAQNARQPLTFLLDSGKEITGVFTSRKDAAIWDDLNQQFQYIGSTAGFGPNSDNLRNVMVNFMRRIDTPQAADILGLPKEADRTDKLGAFYRKVQFDKGGGRDHQIVDLFTKISNIDVPGVAPLKNGPLDYRKMSSILQGGPLKIINTAISRASSSIMNNTMAARIHDGARLDNRNAAMSAVASLLGVSSVVAKSVPMKIIDKDGNPIEGTFMMEAEGVDSTNVRPEEEQLGGSDALENLDGSAFQSIANLQVLDYICGNTDRHSHNVAYQFDKNGKFKGVQGFDNDSSFGKLIPSDKDNVTSHLVHVGQMGVISSTLFQRIRNTTPDMLRFSLRGFDLSEEELDAACARMKQVRDAAEKDLVHFKEEEANRSPRARQTQGPLVEKGRLRVIQPNEFKNLNVESLLITQKTTWYKEHGGPESRENLNFFGKALRNVLHMGDKDLEREAYRSLRSDVVLGADNRGNPAAPAQEAAKAHDLATKMRNCTNFRGTSPEFQAMQAAVARYAAFQDKLKDQISTARDALKGQNMNNLNECHRELLFESVVTFGDLSEMQKLSREIREAAQVYLNKKDQGDKKHNTYTQKRIDVAREVLAFAREAVTSEEIETATRNERRMNEYMMQSAGAEFEAQDARKMEQVGESEKKEPVNGAPKEKERSRKGSQKNKTKPETNGPKL